MALNSTINAPELTAEQIVRILVKPLEARAHFLAARPPHFDTTGPLRIPNWGHLSSPTDKRRTN